MKVTETKSRYSSDCKEGIKRVPVAFIMAGFQFAFIMAGFQFWNNPTRHHVV
jgi:hypothetical protein